MSTNNLDLKETEVKKPDVPGAKPQKPDPGVSIPTPVDDSGKMYAMKPQDQQPGTNVGNPGDTTANPPSNAPNTGGVVPNRDVSLKPEAIDDTLKNYQEMVDKAQLSSGNVDGIYGDKRFAQVESEKNAALDEMEKTYQGMIDQSDGHFQGLIDASKEWADKQSQLQQEQTDFAIDQIEQQKQQAEQDYLREQSGAYVDWQKQSNQYGVNAEKMAASGLTNSGYSESSQVAMYTAYQNRVAVARESFQNATLNYNNAITEARLQNNSMLAEIAYNSLQQQLELSLQGFQYKNQLILDKTAQLLEVENMYYNRYQDVLAQINHEIALAEQIRQFNETLAEEKRQFDAQYGGAGGYGGSGGGGYSSGGGSYSGGYDSNYTGSNSGTTNAPVVDNGGSGSGLYVAPDGGTGTGVTPNTQSGPTINYNSVINAGLGPVNEQGIVNAVNQGKVDVIQADDQIFIVKDPSVPFTPEQIHNTTYNGLTPVNNTTTSEDLYAALGYVPSSPNTSGSQNKTNTTTTGTSSTSRVNYPGSSYGSSTSNTSTNNNTTSSTSNKTTTSGSTSRVNYSGTSYSSGSNKTTSSSNNSTSSSNKTTSSSSNKTTTSSTTSSSNKTTTTSNKTTSSSKNTTGTKTGTTAGSGGAAKRVNLTK